MSKVIWKGGTLLSPVPPVMVSCGDMDNSNIITIAWTGILNSNPPKTYVSIRPQRHSFEIIKNTKEFVINLTPASRVKEADYCGIYTGAKVDKFEKCNFTKAASSTVSCPMIEECPMNLECKVTDIVELGSHHMFIADITAINVDESLLGEDGKLHLEKAKLAAFAHGEYFELGKKIGSFGFSVKKKKSKKHYPKKK
ncbi:MAG: flavin reductase family protein [Clostridia bacterium]|nr:flavin reductase family protein [Clostridia bacterium]